MRILHTSDWHLGRSFGTVSLSADQDAFAQFLVDVVRDERVDLVVVAGDVYDRAIPPADAVALFRDILQRLRAGSVRTVAIAGNHDGPERISAYDGLVDEAGVHVRGGYRRAGEVLTVPFDDGPLDIVAVPYLDPVLAPSPLADPGEPSAEAGDAPAAVSRPTHQSVLRDALDSARANLRSPRSLAVAHAFVTGGSSCDSERLLSVGGTGEVDAAVFEGFSYVALGHLHRPQQVGSPTRRYSGTPLPYSFSEEHDKEVVVVDLDEHGACTVHPIAVPVGRKVATLRGTIDELLDDRRFDGVHDRFVRAQLTDRAHVVDAKVRLRQRFPYVVEVELVADTAMHDPVTTSRAAHRRRLAPFEAASAFWRDVTGADLLDDEADVLKQAIADVHAGAAVT